MHEMADHLVQIRIAQLHVELKFEILHNVAQVLVLNFVFIIIIIIIINEYLEAGQGPLFPSEVDNIYTNINQN